MNKKLEIGIILYLLVLFFGLFVLFPAMSRAAALNIEFGDMPLGAEDHQINVYWGVASDVYTHGAIGEPGQLSFSANGFLPGTTYYFSGRYYAPDGVFSGQSNEFVYTVPTLNPIIRENDPIEIDGYVVEFKQITTITPN